MYVPPLGAGEWAGAPGFRQPNWNNATSGFSALSPILDSNGQTLPGITMDPDNGKACYNSWVQVNPPYDGDSYLMRGYIGVFSGNPPSVTITGLGAPFTVHGYRVHVYFDGDNPTDWITAYTLTVGGSHVETIYGKDAGGANFNGTYTQATGATAANATPGNYVRFTGLTASSFTLTATPVTGMGQGPINGLQIIALPEPASLALVGVGLAATLVARRRSPAGG